MVFDKLKAIIAEQLSIDESVINMDTNLMKDLEADSLDAVEIIMALEEEYDIEIPDEEAEKFQTVDDIVKYVEDHISKGEEYSILPSPAQSRFLPDEHGIYDSTLVQEQWQPLVVNELKNKRLRCYLSDTETINVLKHIHRTSRVALEENGANSLFLALGILKWYETDRSIKPRYAPILMIPVDLIRHAGSNYVIRSRGEETIINVTLIEMIKQQFQLTMPGLSPLPTDSDGVDVRQVMAIVRNAIMSRPRWDVLDEAMLGLFSFSKFVMWNDIHNHALQLSRHPVIQALADGKALNPDDTEQADVDARELDQQSSPAEFAIPVDVDSSN